MIMICDPNLILVSRYTGLVWVIYRSINHEQNLLFIDQLLLTNY